VILETKRRLAGKGPPGGLEVLITVGKGFMRVSRRTALLALDLTTSQARHGADLFVLNQVDPRARRNYRSLATWPHRHDLLTRGYSVRVVLTKNRRVTARCLCQQSTSALADSASSASAAACKMRPAVGAVHATDR